MTLPKWVHTLWTATLVPDEVGEVGEHGPMTVLGVPLTVGSVT